MPIPKIVATVALTAAQVAIGMMRKIKGPRLDDLSVSVADYGTPIPRVWGMRRIQPQTIWAEKLHEKKAKTKGKGGKYEEYKYDGTWACLICDHEIQAVTRVWMDKHLVWQQREKGPISVGGLISLLFGNGIVKLQRGRNMRIYLGTEDQRIDPRMEAWCEERYGPDSCPAYRGSAYVVFQQIPLEKFGNRIPQLTFEVVSSKTPAFPYDIRDGAGSGIDGVFSPDGMLMYQEDTTELFVWDVPTRTLINRRPIPGGRITATQGALWVEGGGFDPASKELWLYGADAGAGGNTTPSGFDVFTGGMRGVGTTPYFYPVTTNETYYGVRGTGSLGVPSVVGVELGFPATHFFEGPNGDAWAVGVDAATEDNLNISQLPPGPFALTASHTTAGGQAYGMWNGAGGIFVWQGGFLYLLDAEDPSILLEGPVAYSIANAYVGPAFNAVPPGAASIWLGFTEFDTQTLEILNTVEPSDWISQSMTGGCYDVVNHALVTHEIGTDEITWRYLDRVGSEGVPLSTIVDDVSGWCGLTTQNTTQLTQTVEGYSVTQGTGKDMIAPLLDIHDTDARPHDFEIQFVNRGGAPTGTILTEDFVRDGNSPRYSVSVVQDTDLPRKLTFNYADRDHDQQANTAISQRPLDAMDSTREETIDLSTYVDTPDGAQQKADRHFRRIWNSRELTKNALTHQLLALEPGDVKTLDLDGVQRHARLDKMTVTPTSIECQWIRDETDIAILNGATGAVMGGRDPETIYIPGPTKGFVKDIPLVDDADNDVNPVIYYAAGPYLSPWPGAGVYRGDDGSYDDLVGFVESGSGATWGYATEVLGTANPNLWDRGNSVNIEVKSGTLATYTEAEIDADPSLNLALLGSELIQFATATLEIDGTYTLTGLKRGRRGTEWAVAGHTDEDEFVLCDDFATMGLGTDDIGDALSFKVQSVARDVESATPIDLTYTAASLKPYAPARIIWTTDGTDMFGEIIRRTRIGGNWNGGSTIPLGENSEAYEVDILDGDDVLRTITVTGTNLFTYTGAEIAADGNTVGVVPAYNAYQMSDVAGRGFALAA